MTPEQVVRGELAAWGRLNLEEIMASTRSTPYGTTFPWDPRPGTTRFASFPSTSWLGSPFSTLKSSNLAAAGPVVLTGASGSCRFRRKAGRRPSNDGVFETVGDKLVAWRDYFDLGGRL